MNKLLKNKSVYLIYDVTNASPNGDPDTSEPRFNEETNRAIVSDLRIKRFGRDFLAELGKEVYYFYDRKLMESSDDRQTGADARLMLFCKEKNIKLGEKYLDTQKLLIDNFIDVRLFGGILTANRKSKFSNANIIGSLQINSASESINEVKLINRGITTVFPSDSNKNQGSMGRDSFIDYSIFCINGRFNANTARLNNVKEGDLELMLCSIWNGMDNGRMANSRSKFGHSPIAFIIIDHPIENFESKFIGRMLKHSFKPVNVGKSEDGKYIFDFSPLYEIVENNDYFDGATVYCNDQEFIGEHFSKLPKSCRIADPFTELLKFA